MKPRITRILVVAIATGGIAGLGLLYWLQQGQPTPSERLTDLPVLVREIQQLSELVSVKYTVQKVVGLEEKKSPFGSEKLLLIVQAQVLAGIELSELGTEDIRLAPERRITIKLPPPKILHILLDEEQTGVWDRQITWWTPWVPYNPDLERQARLAALESVRDTAVEMGILDDALQSTRQGIRTLLEALGARSVEFEPPPSGK